MNMLGGGITMQGICFSALRILQWVLN